VERPSPIWTGTAHARTVSPTPNGWRWVREALCYQRRHTAMQHLERLPDRGQPQRNINTNTDGAPRKLQGQIRQLQYKMLELGRWAWQQGRNPLYLFTHIVIEERRIYHETWFSHLISFPFCSFQYSLYNQERGDGLYHILTTSCAIYDGHTE
jgi:hypothetical protein